MRREIRHVEWIDSAVTHGWTDDDGLKDHGVARCRTVGFVLRETDDEVWLAHSVDTRHGGYDSVMAIPVVAIAKSTTIRKAKP